MCIEIHTRYRRCSHTCALRWSYCAILTPRERQPPTGRACRKYKLRYKDTTDNTDCFECKLAEVAGWGAVRSPTFSKLPERSPTMSSFFGGGIGEGIGVRSPTFSTFRSELGLLGGGKGDRESRETEVSVVASDGPMSPAAAEKKDWRGSGESKESGGKEDHSEEADGRGVRGWFKKKFKAREGYEGGQLGFQMMDA